MKLKIIITSFLIGVFYVVLLLTNYIFISAYIETYEVSNFGERVDIRPVELLRKPDDGYKGYTYSAKLGEKQVEVFIKSKLDFNSETSVIISPSNPGRIYLENGDGGILTVFNGMTGNWLLSILAILMHIFILKLSWMAFIKVPRAFFEKSIS